MARRRNYFGDDDSGDSDDDGEEEEKLIIVVMMMVAVQLLSHGRPLHSVFFIPTRSPDNVSLRAVLFTPLSSSSPQGHRTTSLSELFSSLCCPLHPHKVTGQRLSQSCALHSAVLFIPTRSPDNVSLRAVLFTPLSSSSPQGHRTTSLSELCSSLRCPLHPHKVTGQRLSQSCALHSAVLFIPTRSPDNVSLRAVLFTPLSSSSPQGHTTSLSELCSSLRCPLHPHKVTGQRLSQGCALHSAVLFTPQGHRTTSLSGLCSSLRSSSPHKVTGQLLSHARSTCSALPTPTQDVGKHGA